MDHQTMELWPIGIIRSPIKERQEAADQGKTAGAKVDLIIFPRYREGLEGLENETHLILLTWMHQAERDLLKVHPRGDHTRPKRGVFSTRSPDRPNPLGLYVVRILGFDREKVTVEGIDVIDGTPLVDVKPFRPELDIPQETRSESELK
jgi:tRNA-Thr(GGU) m(6)t(6)A37 methyltransferase TsaA